MGGFGFCMARIGKSMIDVDDGNANKSKRAKIKPRQNHEDLDTIYMLSVIRKMSSRHGGVKVRRNRGGNETHV